jgi:hypothetical protein
MLDKIFKLIQRWAASSERDRLEGKFDHIDEKFDDVDKRFDNIERWQARQDEKLSSINQVTLANNEALEQKLNRSVVTAQSVRDIVDVRINGFQDSLKRLEELLNQLLRRDGNLP